METGDSIEGSGRKKRSRRRKKNKNAENKDVKKDVLTHAVVVPSARLSWRKINLLKELEEKYKELVIQFVEYGFKHGVTGHVSLRKALYEELRRRHPDLPSHYIYTAAQDASQRIKSFLALKREGKARTERPEVRKVSVWLDDRLWAPDGYTAVRVATHRGRITIPLRPTKQFWKHINGGWRLKSQPKLKLDEKRRVVYVYFVFEKEIEEKLAKGVVAVDLNENNVTVKIGNKVFMFETRIRGITLGYNSRREVMQSVKGNRYTSRALKRNELSKKSDIRRKIANLIVKEAERLGAAIAVENLPRDAPKI
ncbi:transposase [Pyrobaculum neutrophilum]|uniref:transposase n=1 Tax=Pyrobaculum neutrophilum TaxID=70771 RepID=UPI0001617C80|nr:transposase [Pyrobaculum neutrophilum]